VRILIAFIVCALLPAAAVAADYTTYIGDEFPYQVTALTTDSAGNTYLTGSRVIVQGSTLPEPTDVFITKLDTSGNIVQTFTLSGKFSDQGNGIAVDSSGNIWVAGVTNSPDFPVRNPLQAAPAQLLGVNSALSTGFLTKLGPDGSILFSTYLGGTQGMSTMNAVAVDTQGNAYVTGSTFAPDYPRTAGLPAGGAGGPIGIGAVQAAFFAKISAAGDKILYAGGVSATQRDCGEGSSCFLSTLYNTGAAIAVDAAGNAYVAGNAGGLGLPTTPGALETNGLGAFVMKVNPSGSGLVYLTMLGSANYIPGGVAPNSNPGNTVLAIAADAAGNAYITGATSDPAFPATASAFQPVYSIPASQIQMDPFLLPPPDAFAAKLNPSGTAMVWASFLGGTAADQGNSIAVDASGNVWVSGTTSSTNFPVSNGVPQGPGFLVEFNPTGSALPYGSRFPADTVAAAMTVDSSGVVDAAGSTGLVSAITPAQASAPQLFGIANAAGGALSGRIAPGELISLYGQHFGVATPAQGSFNAGGFLPDSLAGVRITIGGVPAPLLYVSDTQINAVAPVALIGPSSTQVQVTLGSGPLASFRAAVDLADPQVFRNPDGSAAAINQDGSVNSASHPAPAGSIVSIWATGTGAFSGSDGQKAATAMFNCDCSIETGVGSPNVTYAGPSPGLVNGVTQINFQIPSSPDAGSAEYFNLVAGGNAGAQTFVYTSP
jgi:uncharacterized protein (TIGR03437 family)